MQCPMNIQCSQLLTCYTYSLAGWWFVNMDEEQGWLPASYLEPEDGSAESIIGKTYKVGGK